MMFKLIAPLLLCISLPACNSDMPWDPPKILAPPQTVQTKDFKVLVGPVMRGDDYNGHKSASFTYFVENVKENTDSMSFVGSSDRMVCVLKDKDGALLGGKDFTLVKFLGGEIQFTVTDHQPGKFECHVSDGR